MYKDKHGEETEISKIVKRREDLDGEEPKSKERRKPYQQTNKSRRPSGGRTARTGRSVMIGTPIPEDPEILDQSNSTSHKLPAKSANKVVKKQQDELNDYLAY